MWPYCNTALEVGPLQRGSAFADPNISMSARARCQQVNIPTSQDGGRIICAHLVPRASHCETAEPNRVSLGAGSEMRENTD